MDSKIIIAAVVAVVAVAAVAGVVILKNDDSESPSTSIVIENGAMMSSDDFASAVNEAIGDDVVIGIKETVTDSTLSFTASDLKQIIDAKKNVVIKSGNAKAILSSAEASAIAALSGKVTLKVTLTTTSSEIVKVLGADYTEARALAKFVVLNESGSVVETTGAVSFAFEYKLDSLMDETAATAVQWDKDLKSTAAKYSNGVATISATAGNNVALAFMSAEDSAYYPVTYTTKANGLTEPFQQTITHKPAKIVTLYEGTTELALLFGLQDYIVMACANSTYSCVNSSLQSTYNNLPGRTEYTNVINSKEVIVAAEPDLIIGWSSSFESEGKWSVGTPGDWNERGCCVFAGNIYNKTLEDYYTLVTTIGLIMNMADRAEEIINEFKNDVAAANEKLNTAGITKMKNVIVIEDGSADTTFLYGAQYFTGDLIAKAGGADVVSDAGMVRKSMEDILKYCYDSDDNCVIDAVFLFNRSGKTEQEVIQAFRDNPGYADLQEAVGDNVFVFGFYELYMGGVCETGIVAKIFGCLYPELAA